MVQTKSSTSDRMPRTCGQRSRQAGRRAVGWLRGRLARLRGS
jgi:hypothetical protein